MICYACSKVIPAQWEESGDYQGDNNLWICFNGGYGMFIESHFFMDEEFQKAHDREVGVTICHECAHDLCERIPWIDNLINPQHSHSHTNDYVQENPNHLKDKHPQQLTWNIKEE